MIKLLVAAARLPETSSSVMMLIIYNINLPCAERDKQASRDHKKNDSLHWLNMQNVIARTGNQEKLQINIEFEFASA